MAGKIERVSLSSPSILTSRPVDSDIASTRGWRKRSSEMLTSAIIKAAITIVTSTLVVSRVPERIDIYFAIFILQRRTIFFAC